MSRVELLAQPEHVTMAIAHREFEHGIRRLTSGPYTTSVPRALNSACSARASATQKKTSHMPPWASGVELAFAREPSARRVGDRVELDRGAFVEAYSYRNSATFCTSATFNLTNGVRAAWVP